MERNNFKVGNSSIETSEEEIRISSEKIEIEGVIAPSKPE